MSKLKHEDMEQDVLIEYSTRLLYFYRNNKAAVWGGGIAILMVIGLIIGYVVFTGQQQTEAENLMGVAEQYYMQGSFERALFGDEDEFTLGFVQIADNYGRTRSGNLAHYYAATAYYELGQYEDALAHIEQFEVPEGITGVGPISFHAVILAEMGEYEAAGRKFIEAAQWDENESTTPHNLLEAAMAFEEAGEYEDALEQLEIIIRDYPNSQQHAEAQRMAGMLTPRIGTS